MDTNKFQYLFQNPNNYQNDYERGIVHGMAFFAQKLIWAEQIYLDALRSNHKNEKKYNFNKNIEADMHKITNRIYQDFDSRANGFNLFKNKKLEEWYNNIEKELGLEINSNLFN